MRLPELEYILDRALSRNRLGFSHFLWAVVAFALALPLVEPIWEGPAAATPACRPALICPFQPPANREAAHPNF
jgi:hypothetical protein